MSANYYKLYKPIAEDKRLTPTAKLVAMYLYHKLNFGEACNYSNYRIAKKLNISKSSVTNSIKLLEELGFIQDLRKKGANIISLPMTEIINSEHYKCYCWVLNLKITTSSKLVLIYILSYESASKICYSSNQKMAESLGLSIFSVKNTALEELKRLKLVVIRDSHTQSRKLAVSLEQLSLISGSGIVEQSISESSLKNNTNSSFSVKSSPKIVHNSLKTTPYNTNNNTFNNTKIKPSVPSLDSLGNILFKLMKNNLEFSSLSDEELMLSINKLNLETKKEYLKTLLIQNNK